MNSGFPDETAIKPKLGSEWSPTERFVSGPAQHPRATRPFVDVQSVVCRTAPFPPSTPRSQDSFNQPSIPTAKQPALNGKPRNTNSVLLTRGEVLVEGLGIAVFAIQCYLALPVTQNLCDIIRYAYRGHDCWPNYKRRIRYQGCFEF